MRFRKAGVPPFLTTKLDLQKTRDMKEYLSNIERKEDKLASLTADLETLKESNAERKRNFKADKKAYEDRIEMISEIEVK